MATTHPKIGTRYPRLGPRSAGLSMSAAEFDAWPSWKAVKGYRYELINGVLVVSPYPGNSELDPNELLGHLLWYHQEYHQNGSRLDLSLAEQTLTTGENRRRCDRAIWAGLGRLPDVEHDAPTIAVEFVSGRRRDFLRDYEEKRDEYLAVGVVEYWVIDRFRRTMTIFRRGPEGPTSQVVAESQTYETPLLPGFVLPLADLLVRADLWKKPRPESPRTSPGGGTDG